MNKKLPIYKLMQVGTVRQLLCCWWT